MARPAEARGFILENLARVVYVGKKMRSSGRVAVQLGDSVTEVLRGLGCSFRSVKNWVAQYNRGGLESLHERPRPGRPRRLDPEHYPRLNARKIVIFASRALYHIEYDETRLPAR